MTRDAQTIVIGAGLAGLGCALRLQEQGHSVLVLEASDEVGGRVRTDNCDGFLLDRGFQVLLTAYPECRRLIDYDALDLRPFYPGALVHTARGFERVADPFRRPLDAAATVHSSIGTLRDKFRILGLRKRSRSGTLEELWSRPAQSTEQALKDAGFSAGMIDGFFRPFLGGVFFDLKLETTSLMLDFVFRMFSNGDTALPAHGMGEIPRQLASRLTEGTVRTGARVRTLAETEVTLESGELLTAENVVLATEAVAAGRLVPGLSPPPSRSTATMYFTAETPPLDEPILVLDGEGKGPVTTLCVPSNVSSFYSPAGAALVSATVIGVPDSSDEELESAVRSQLTGWFGEQVGDWRLLRTYRIPHALPTQRPEDHFLPPHTFPGLQICGDYTENGSFQGALLSGQRAADRVLSGVS